MIKKKRKKRKKGVNGKAKGGKFEHTIARTIAEHFNPLKIKEDDCYRTKNSGATVRQPGDIQFSPALRKVFPAVIECKHYRSIHYKMNAPIESQINPIKEWWKQFRQEQRQAKKSHALLIMRENRCPIVVAFFPAAIDRIAPNVIIKKAKFRTIIKTSWKGDPVWIVPLTDFLHYYVAMRILCTK